MVCQTACQTHGGVTLDVERAHLVSRSVEERMHRWSGRMCRAARLAVLMLASWGTVAAQDFAGREKLRAHGEREFRKDVIKVTDGVYVAVGYSMANVSLIAGDGGTIIVDTTSTLDDAQAVKAEFS